MRIGALRVPSDGRQYRRAEGLASVTVKATLVFVRLRCESQYRGAGVGPDGRRMGAATGGGVAVLRRGGRATCHGASALFAPWSPTHSAVAVLLSARRPGRRRALHRPAALRLPPCRCAPLARPLLPPRTRPAPKNFPHRAGKIDCAAGPE